MSKSDPSISHREMIQHLTSLGFKAISQKGSHRKFKDSKNNIIIVPVHPNQKTLKIGMKHQIKKQLSQYGY